MTDFSILIRPHDRIILAIREHIGAEEAVGVGGGEGVRVDEPAVGEVVVPALEVVEARFAVVVIAAAATFLMMHYIARNKSTSNFEAVSYTFTFAGVTFSFNDGNSKIS